jgi:transposase InsO family protein
VIAPQDHTRKFDTNEQYYWRGWAADVEAAVAKCLACEMVRLKKPGRQGRLVKYHPTRRFELVAVDMLEMTSVTRRGNRKVLVIGDMFSRFVMAIATKDEKADTVAKAIFERWIYVFGPPERLLSDRGRNFTADVIENLCKRVGTKKICTSAYHPQTNGFVERYNQTLCRELRRHLIDDKDWDVTLSMAQFRLRADDEPEGLAVRLREVHAQLLQRGIQSRDKAAQTYHRAVQETEFTEGERVLVWDDASALAIGRKL